MRSHCNSHPSIVHDEDETDIGEGEGPIPQSLLKKYIVYAKKHVRPSMSNIDRDKVCPHPCEDGIGTGPPRARTQDISVDVGIHNSDTLKSRPWTLPYTLNEPRTLHSQPLNLKLAPKNTPTS